MGKTSLCLLAILAVSGCTDADQAPIAATPEEVSEPAGPAPTSIAAAMVGNWRSDAAKARDQFRHPAETLEFCQIDPSGHVAEIWPGSGWVSQILVPWTHANGGQFRAAVIDPESSERAASLLERYLGQFSDTDLFGQVSYGAFGANSDLFAEAGSQDAVLTFRNVHSWMGRGMAEKAFADFYQALKPGGVLCVIEHRLPSSTIQNPKADTGYVQEAMVKALASEAGFVFEAASEINANSHDMADHPFGVWTLPPVRRSPKTEDEQAEFPDFDRAAYDAIGESDRMTLRFRKPTEEEADK
jgi:predicted methyltransferase